ncbi:MAG: hypothetical protein J4478_04345 [Candidatus Diapherotrites archaeon]|uniref:Large ribosomal subunit protein eL31 n=1 Tax=Candidatus Iainarchaeum sp. TaxID=3101447 RepID=A0A8T4KYA8_9ARCH|nr:hypothetical protein [Candidatus Diapherotrites archaeon]
MAEKEKESKSAEYTVSLRKASLKGRPDIQKAKNAIAILYKFFQKKYHKPKEQVKISNEVNEEVWKNSNNIQARIQVQAIKKDNKVLVYLKESKELKKALEKEREGEKKTAEKKKEEEKKKAAEKKSAEKEKKEETKEEKPPAEKTEKLSEPKQEEKQEQESKKVNKE